MGMYWSGGPGVAGSGPFSPILSRLQCVAALSTLLQPIPTLRGSVTQQGPLPIP
jgi:hypothetical protein